MWDLKSLCSAILWGQPKVKSVGFILYYRCATNGKTGEYLRLNYPI